MDIPRVVFGIFLIPVYIKKRGSLVISTLLLITLFLSNSLFFDDWIRHSFVGRSSHVAKNFKNTLDRISIDPKTNLCVINQSGGWWQTANGELIYFVDKDYSGKVISTWEDNTFSCEEGIVLKNVGEEYIELPNKESIK